ncbi:hypothetical protein T07_12934 [Trichinella nelsoni]|uniref:Uncharacterized protein n=1 Tax=Trichinella nelsoni TaxID=6336 RepID=A0A0V0RYN9_9BILA|nr:hypothetical protein T07_12934 [Trichinella nelsoni]
MTIIISRNAFLEPVGANLFVFPKHLDSQQILLTVSLRMSPTFIKSEETPSWGDSEDSSVPNKAGTDIVLADHVLPGFLKRELSELFLHIKFSLQPISIRLFHSRYLSDAEYKQCTTYFKMHGTNNILTKSSEQVNQFTVLKICVLMKFYTMRRVNQNAQYVSPLDKIVNYSCSIRGTVAALLLHKVLLHTFYVYELLSSLPGHQARGNIKFHLPADVLHIARITSKQSKRTGIAVHSAAMIADVAVQMIKSGVTTKSVSID